MSDEEDLNPRELLLKTQRKEKKELQGKIQALKKVASKGDKKKKKETAEEIASLEAELNARHKDELAALDTKDKEEEKKEDVVVVVRQNGVVNDDNNDEDGDGGENSEHVQQQQRVSKAQKRRDKKAEKERERQREIEAQEEENRYGARNREAEMIRSILEARRLAIKEVPSNGDCLFAGLVHHLQLAGVQSSVKDLRRAATEEMKNNPDDYLPFLSNASGDMLDQEGFENYCQKMLETPAWGGQVELRALSKALKRPIEVIQADGPRMVIGEDEFASDRNLILTYHRHAYGLGEHYNAAVKKS